MTVLHLVSNRVLPYPGGLQESVMRIGGSLAEAGYRVIVYTLDQPPDYRFPIPAHQPLTLVHLDNRDLLLEPYGSGEVSDLYATEKSRTTGLLLRNAVEREKDKAPHDRHLILSFYASGTGFLAQLAATALQLPHIVAVRGTDFELEIHGVRQHPRLRLAVEAASLVVTTNRAQAAALADLFRLRQPIRTIHNALPQAGERAVWEAPPGDPVRLFSDCGFSGRKATQVLLRAAAELIDRGLSVSLTVAGGVFWLESPRYWEELRGHYQSRYPGRFSFPGHLSHEELDEHLRSSHLYCSASLAEGSSMGRIRALTIGIPMVSTRTGSLPETAGNCRHVRLCRPGDLAALTAALEAAVSETRAGTLQPDRGCIEDWRKHFCVERERAEWIAAIEAALAH